MNQAIYVSLSLIGLVAIVGAGVGVGSGVALISQQPQAKTEPAKH